MATSTERRCCAHVAKRDDSIDVSLLVPAGDANRSVQITLCPGCGLLLARRLAEGDAPLLRRALRLLLDTKPATDALAVVDTVVPAGC